MPYQYICEPCKNRVEVPAQGQYACPTCGQGMKLERAIAPKAFRCTNCGESIPGHPDFAVNSQMCEFCGVGVIVPVW
jgi:DNA-directed RNA polymerase subunit RPC12/RpoP